MFRARVVRADGRAINVVQRRAHLSYCFTGCCCGRTERGYAAVPVDTFKDEWLRRKLRNVVHLTKAGCLGPCALANVASLVFDGRAVWFHSVNTPWHVRLIYDYIETMVRRRSLRRAALRAGRVRLQLLRLGRAAAGRKCRPPGVSLRTSRRASDIALLSHADTDLLALKRRAVGAAADLDVIGVSLVRAADRGAAVAAARRCARAGAQVLVLRLHGELDSRAWIRAFARLVGRTRRRWWS